MHALRMRELPLCHLPESFTASHETVFTMGEES